MTPQNKIGAPPPSCFELSIFGAGIGEALAIHTGGNEWLLVDSCLDPATGESAALNYLSRIGVSSDQVRVILATHWHEDHVGGIDQLLTAFPKARFHVPAAFRSEHLYKLVRAGAERETLGTDALRTSKSFDRALSVLLARRAIDRIVPTTADQLLRESNLGGIGPVMVFAISPSSHAYLKAQQEFADFVEFQLNARRRPVPLDPNHSAVALWIRWGNHRVVLGSDLIDTPDARLGWKAAIGSQILIGESAKATVVKVSHHGSGNGHSQDFWDKHVAAGVGGLTTYATGKSPPPQPRDIDRLKRQCALVLCAPLPLAPKSPAVKSVSKFARSQGISIRPRTKRFGHIRIRMDVSGAIQHDCFRDAAVM